MVDGILHAYDLKTPESRQTYGSECLIYLLYFADTLTPARPYEVVIPRFELLCFDP